MERLRPADELVTRSSDDDEDAMMVVKIGETARILNVTNASFHVLFGFFFAFWPPKAELR